MVAWHLCPRTNSIEQTNAPGASRAPGKLVDDASGAVADDALDLEEIVDGPIGVFAAVAGLLVAAEGRERVPFRIVDRNLSGAQATGHFSCMVNVLRLHIGGEAIDGVVGDLHRVV